MHSDKTLVQVLHASVNSKGTDLETKTLINSFRHIDSLPTCRRQHCIERSAL